MTHYNEFADWIIIRETTLSELMIAIWVIEAADASSITVQAKRANEKPLNFI